MKLTVPVVLFSLFITVSTFGYDIREVAMKAEVDYERAVLSKEKRVTEITADRDQLLKNIGALKKEIESLDADITRCEAEYRTVLEKEKKLREIHAEDETAMDAFVGAFRIAAKHLETVLIRSFHTVKSPERLSTVEEFLEKDRFPGIDDIREVSAMYMEEIKRAGGVLLEMGSFINTDGNEVTGKILTIGKFTAAYQKGDEIGFLKYLEEDHRFSAIRQPPAFQIRNVLKDYLVGKSDNVVMDISQGAVFQQMIHQKSVTERISDGGLLAIPILALGLFAVIIAVERLIYLRGVHDNADKIMGKVNSLAGKGRWEECDTLATSKKGLPVYNVLKAGLAARGEDRETLESVLQEAILKELPRLERFLPMLNIMGAVAPLLGLLGTVTGMIATFHVITVYGTGDPRMMSGGISEALVTTMLGLCVAIPIMLIHTFLGRRVEHIVGDMEEKAVALTNIIFRKKTDSTV